MKKRENNAQKGFTLVELIVVLVILAILAALLIPALTGYIDRAHKKSTIAECKLCVTASQSALSENYGKSTGTNQTDLIPTPEEVVKLAEVSGSINEITADDIGDNAKLMHLTYISNSKYTVVYCADSANCGLHEEMYTVTEGETPAISQSDRAYAIMDAFIPLKATITNIDSNAAVFSSDSVAAQVYAALPDNIKTALQGSTWYIRKEGGTNNYNLYMYDGELTQSMVNQQVTVTQYQYKNGTYTEVSDAKRTVKWNSNTEKEYLVLR